MDHETHNEAEKAASLFSRFGLVNCAQYLDWLVRGKLKNRQKIIAVTGAAGRLRVKVAARLAKLGIKQRLIVRDLARAPNLPGAEVVCASSSGDAMAMGL